MNLSPVIVREYAKLTASEVENPSLDHAHISQSAFDWLCTLAGQFRKTGASLLQVDNALSLRLDNFVGVLESPCGQVIEILPKTSDVEDPASARSLLIKMIAVALKLPARETEEAGLELSKAPLSEWMMRRFLADLEHLIKRGLRFEYLRIEEEQRFLRGQLDVAKQLRQPPGKQHLFQIRHDVFLPNRAENRLLKSALDLVCKKTKDAANWRLAHELAQLLHELPASRDIVQDFKLWRKDRLMAHYQPIKPWVELILRQKMPLAVKGNWRGISFLFPMEKLFEQFVEAKLRPKLVNGAELIAQTQEKSLCRHREQDFFKLKPDFMLKHDDKTWVMDTKWKLINQSKVLDSADDNESHYQANYKLSQSDFYQLFAYGHKYIGGKGNLVLIYPCWEKFKQPLEPFFFTEKNVSDAEQLTLHVLPFDLRKECLIWPEGYYLQREFN